MAPGSMKKALRFPVKVDGGLRVCETSKNLLVEQRFGAPRKVDQKTL